MRTFDAAIAHVESAGKLPPGTFRKLCRDVFGTADGQRLLAIMCQARHPLNHDFCADGRAAAHLDGNKEVVAYLWHLGATSSTPPEPKPNKEP